MLFQYLFMGFMFLLGFMLVIFGFAALSKINEGCASQTLKNSLLTTVIAGTAACATSLSYFVCSYSTRCKEDKKKKDGGISIPGSVILANFVVGIVVLALVDQIKQSSKEDGCDIKIDNFVSLLLGIGSIMVILSGSYYLYKVGKWAVDRWNKKKEEDKKKPKGKETYVEAQRRIITEEIVKTNKKIAKRQQKKSEIQKLLQEYKTKQEEEVGVVYTPEDETKIQALISNEAKLENEIVALENEREDLERKRASVKTQVELAAEKLGRKINPVSSSKSSVYGGDSGSFVGSSIQPSTITGTGPLNKQLRLQRSRDRKEQQLRERRGDFNTPVKQVYNPDHISISERSSGPGKFSPQAANFLGRVAQSYASPLPSKEFSPLGSVRSTISSRRGSPSPSVQASPEKDPVIQVTTPEGSVWKVASKQPSDIKLNPVRIKEDRLKPDPQGFSMFKEPRPDLLSDIRSLSSSSSSSPVGTPPFGSSTPGTLQIPAMV